MFNSAQRFVSDLNVVNIYHAPFLQNGNLSDGCQIFSGKSSPKDRSQDRKLLFKISSLLDKVRMSLCSFCCITRLVSRKTEASRIFLLELSAWRPWQASFGLGLGLHLSEYKHGGLTMSTKKQKASQTETEIRKKPPLTLFHEGSNFDCRYRYLLLSLFSLPIVGPLFPPQKELDATSYPENLFEEHSDASDIDVSGDQDYLLEEKKCNKVGSYSKLISISNLNWFDFLSNMLQQTCSVMMSTLFLMLLY